MTEVFGLPVKGEIQYYSENPKEQKPLEELEPLFKAVLDDPDVVKFGWTQYTPYFNDGDACIFGTWGVWVQRKDDQREEDDEEYRWNWEVSSYSYDGRPASPPHHVELANAIGSGHYDMALLKTFGDPAEVTVTRDGITVEFYDHD